MEPEHAINRPRKGLINSSLTTSLKITGISLKICFNCVVHDGIYFDVNSSYIASWYLVNSYVQLFQAGEIGKGERVS